VSLKTRNTISVAVIVLLAAGLFLFVWKVMLFGPSGPYTVKAEFQDSGGITHNSDVKIGGVPAGTITDLELTKRDTAVITMKLDEGYPIGSGAVANSRPVNLLGEKYIELLPGDMRHKQKSGVLIPESRTSRPTELDDMLNILQPDVRARMRILINEAGIALAGRGANFNDLLDKLPPALDQTEKVVADFSRDNGRLKSAVVQSDRVLASFTRKNEDLQKLVDSAAGTLRITADKRRQIAATLQQAPSTVRQLQSTLADLGGTATQLEPMARQVRATAPQLARTLRDVPDFTKDASPALSAASKAAPALTSLGRRATAPVQRLEPTLGQLDEFAGRLAPVTDVADKDKGLIRLLNVLETWSRVVNRQDGLGHTFGTQATVDRTLITGAVQKYLDLSKGNRRSKGKRKAAPKATPAPAPRTRSPQSEKPKVALPKLPKLKLPPVPKVKLNQDLKKTLDQVGGGVDKALDGLTGQQRSDGQKGATGKLLDYLMGS
jgi:phospholipid/cholesterol/gamma-HCH transport system substrate-binding protein